ncbi:MAG TPA: transposase domain-containing protein [Sphingobium sp.]
MSIMGDIVAAGSQTWFSAEELAALRLPGLPRSKRHINETASAERWALKVDADGNPLARRRAGRGGGTEYHLSVLPAAARVALAGSTETPLVTGPGHPIAANDEAGNCEWQWFDRQTSKVKEEATRRNAIVNAVMTLEEVGLTRSAAVAEVASQHGVSVSTLWGWLRLVAGLAASDWLPALSPRRKGGGAKSEIDPAIWTIFKSDYLRLSQPPLSDCYRRAKEVADDRGIAIPIAKTFQRKLEREVPPNVITLLRKGDEALRRAMPSQRRTVANLHALELVNIDGHTFDVFVNWGKKDAKGKPIAERCTMVAIQDVMSRKILAWRIGESESAILTRLAFADLFRKWGIPKGCLLDNGRAFASKWITGGALTRFRFKIREDEPTGLLPALGVNPHWATPYRGQSKPIERGFRDLCTTIAKHPAMEGAYTGNKPTAKPENYGSRAIPIADFIKHVEQGIARHNAQMGRRTEMARDGSFDQAFADSYARAPIGKATTEQLRLALLTGENRRVDRQTGQIAMLGNRYWSAELQEHYGQIVTVRFDPDDLHQDVHVYDLAGGYICSAPVIQDTGFLDVAAAKDRARLVANHRKSARQAVEAQQLLAASDVAAMLARTVEPEAVETTVVRPVRHRGSSAAALKVVRSAQPQHDQFMEDFGAGLTRLRVVE